MTIVPGQASPLGARAVPANTTIVPRDSNSITRLVNSVLVNRADQALYTPRSIYTNTPIVNFPRTLNGIMELDGEEGRQESVSCPDPN